VLGARVGWGGVVKYAWRCVMSSVVLGLRFLDLDLDLDLDLAFARGVCHGWMDRYTYRTVEGLLFVFGLVYRVHALFVLALFNMMGGVIDADVFELGRVGVVD
jgi:hypothetical protein